MVAWAGDRGCYEAAGVGVRNICGGLDRWADEGAGFRLFLELGSWRIPRMADLRRSLKGCETGCIQFLKFCLRYSDYGAYAASHGLSAALLNPRGELGHVVERHKPPTDNVSGFWAVYLTDHEY